jgi:DNA invertase Pin-like site-specific DNA recombinase
MTNGLYFRVSSDRQTTQNQFEDLLEAAEMRRLRPRWARIRQTLDRAIYQEDRPSPEGLGRDIACH